MRSKPSSFVVDHMCSETLTMDVLHGFSFQIL
jgi:hypothetical protein